MNENYEKVLNLGIGIDKFFAITIYKYKIVCLADYTKSLYDEITSLGYEFVFKSAGYIEAKKDDIEISLHLKP